MRWCDVEPCPLSWAGSGLLCDQRCPVPSTCVVRPNGHKTCQRRNAGRFTVFRDEDAPAQVRASRFLPGLPALLAAYVAAGYAPTPGDPVFPQCAPGGARLLPVPSTCGSLRQAVARATRATPLAAQRLSAHSFAAGVCCRTRPTAFLAHRLAPTFWVLLLALTSTTPTPVAPRALRCRVRCVWVVL